MLSNVSYRYKIPASLSLVIVVTALAVAVPLISGTNETAKRDLVDHALSLGKTLAGALQPALLERTAWIEFWRLAQSASDITVFWALNITLFMLMIPRNNRVDTPSAMTVSSNPKPS